MLSFLPFKGMEPRAPEALWGTSQFDSWFLLDIVDHITTDYMTVASLGLRHVVAKQTKHISMQKQCFIYMYIQPYFFKYRSTQPHEMKLYSH